MDFTKETRAKRGWIETTRVRKDGKTVPAKQHMVVSEGMYSTKEMEKVMQDVAKDVGADSSQIRVEYYNHGDAPIEANPRHRPIVSQTQWGGFGEGIRKNANHPVAD